MKTWTVNEQVKSADLNEAFSLLAQQSIPLFCGENVLKNDALVISASYQPTPIAFDTKAGANVGNNTTLTYPITIASNSDRVLIVAVGTVGTTGAVTSVTHNGQALTKIQEFAGTDNGRGVAGSISLWRLIAPATGTKNIVVTQSGSVSMGSYAYSFYNVNQTSPVDVSGGKNTNGSYSITTTGLADVLLNFSTNFAGSGSPSNLSSLTFGGVNAVGLTDNSGYAFGAYGITAGYSPVAQTQGATTIAPAYSDNSYMTASVGCALKPSQPPSFAVIKSNASSTLKIGFIGFAKANASAGQNVDVLHMGVVGGFTGLTAGSTYYLSNTAGQVSTTAGTNSKKVGVAVSATEMLLNYQI